MGTYCTVDRKFGVQNLENGKCAFSTVSIIFNIVTSISYRRWYEFCISYITVLKLQYTANHNINLIVHKDHLWTI